MKTTSLATLLGTLLASLVLTILISAFAVESALTTRMRHSEQEVAQSLAISLSRESISLGEAQALVDAHFSLGAYKRIRILNANGQVIYGREQTTANAKATLPDTRLFGFWALRPRNHLVPAHANIKQNNLGMAVVSLESLMVFDYATSQRWLTQLVATTSLLLTIGALLLLWRSRREEKALQTLHQGLSGLEAAQWVQLPRAQEAALDPLYCTFNRVSNLINERVNRAQDHLEQLNRLRRFDDVSGLLNRAAFIGVLQSLQQSIKPTERIRLVVLRATNLPTLNRARGRTEVDHLIRQLGSQLAALEHEHAVLACARISGSDWVLALPTGASAVKAGAHVVPEVQRDAAAMGIELSTCEILVAHDDPAPFVIARCDAFENTLPPLDALNPKDDEPDAWSARLDQGLLHHRFFLQVFPVADSGGRLIHQECYVRLLEKSTQRVFTGASIMGWAEHLHRAADIDFEVLNLAINRIIEHDEPVCINVSDASLSDPARRQAWLSAMQDAWRYCGKLRVDVPESFAFREPAALRDWVAEVGRLGAEVGVEHLDTHAGQLLNLRGSGIRYVKVASQLTAGLLAAETAGETERLLSALLQSAEDLKLPVIAEGVEHPSQQQVLFQLGFAGATGPAIG